jgi:hypothetical protein
MNELQSIAFVLLWIVLFGEGILLFILYRHVGLVYARRDSGLAVGSQAPLLPAKDVRGKRMALTDLLTAEYNLLVFGSFGCSPCRTLLMDDNISKYLKKHTIPSRFVVSATELGSDAFREFSKDHQSSLEVIATESKTFGEYRVNVTPFAYMLDRHGTVVARGSVAGPGQIMELCARGNKLNDGLTEKRTHTILDTNIASK